MLSLRNEPGLKLYSHNVLIQEYSKDLLPKWLEFVDGVVDSEDLPLNVSRETVQNSRMIRQLAKTLRARVLRELSKLASDSGEKYAAFWQQYGRVLKEGLAIDPEAKDDLLPMFRFYSSTSDLGLTTLDDYVERMADEQTDIYYVLGDDRQSVSFSPHLDQFKARALEVLYLVDPIDPFIAPLLMEYRDKKLRNIDDAELTLPEMEDEISDPAEPVAELPDADFNRFIGRCVTTLGNKVVEVRESRVLKNSPVRLVSPADSPSRDFERVYKYLDQEFDAPKRILEVNRRHPLITNLSRLVTEDPNDALITTAIEQLYESALLLEGLHPNPTTMLPRIQALMELAAERSRPTKSED